eukprot:661176-Amorphochlora_amoeboformis.AAC.1
METTDQQATPPLDVSKWSRMANKQNGIHEQMVYRKEESHGQQAYINTWVENEALMAVCLLVSMLC